MKYDHVMLDLETGDNVASAAIAAIGAVAFAGPSAGAYFYTAVDLDSSAALGLTTSVDTMAWWSRQSPEAQAVFCDPQRRHVADALREFAAFMQGLSTPRVWGNGASFDNAIMSYAYRQAGLALPWKFWNDRCYRTAMAGVIEKPVRTGTYHNALDDARTQATHLLAHRPEALYE